MATISAGLVKELREKTGAGMMDCKKALSATDGDMQKAIDYLREKGIAKAEKKAGRIAAEGAVAAYVSADAKTGVLVEINCETDFAAGNDQFRSLEKTIAEHIATAAPADLDALNDSMIDGKKVSDLITEATATIGEKISLRRFVRYQTEGRLASYIHMGGKVGVLVEVATDEAGRDNEDVKQFAHDLALQIAAARPEAVRREEVASDKLEKEKEIQRAKAIEAGKPEKIVDRIVDGQIEKYYKEVCLLDQAFVKDPDKDIKSLMAEVSKKAGVALDVVRFARFERGEGIEKRKDDLAAEIAAMQKA